MTAARSCVATWINSSFGMKLSSPTNSVSSPNRRLDRNSLQRASSAALSVMYRSSGGVITVALLGWAVGALRRLHRFPCY